jgi:hypothetical protein
MDFKKEISTCDQIGDSCVKTAVEILRQCLGYDTPSGIDHGPFYNEEVYSSIGKWFPKHVVIAFGSEKEKGYIKQENVLYGGTDFDVIKYKQPCLWMFSYTTKRQKMAHMVIGSPHLYGDMQWLCAFQIIL